MPNKTITLGDRSEEFEVKLARPKRMTDDDGEAPRGTEEFVYRPALVTRSSQRKIRRIQWQLEQFDKRDLPKKIDADGDEVLDLGALTEEQLAALDTSEAEVMRLMCDIVSVSLKAPDGAPSAGDILFEGWSQDEIEESEIYGLMADMNKARAGEEDPTPA